MTEHSAAASGTEQPPRARAWLSRSLSDLFDRHYRRHRDRPPHFDVLIIGSGYGGAVAAASLAGFRLKSQNGGPGRRLRIAVLERGREYLPGAFPSQLSELPGHVRFSLPGATSPSGVRTGLFDVRVAADMISVVANGLGGGSLINAGVMLQPKTEVLAEARWPAQIRSDPDALTPFFVRAAQWLGAGTREIPNNIRRAAAAPTKFNVMRATGGQATDAVPITVALAPGVSSGGVAMTPCLACGDCATGCNHGAKDSLDVNLLVHARLHGAKIYTGATVLRLEKLKSGWSVVVNHTDAALRQRQGKPLRIQADKVILAAGTFGSTEILQRSRDTLPLSSRLGHQFSGNGDLFAAAYDLEREVNAVASESVEPAQRNVGPTITAAIDAREKHGVSIQELAVPGPLRRLFEEVFTTARTLHSLGQHDFARHARGDADRNAVDAAAFGRTLPLALIGRDGADGELVLARGGEPDADDDEGDGAVHVRWPGAAKDQRFDQCYQHAKDLLVRRRSRTQLLPNPAWKLLPDDDARTLGIAPGPLLTVHPLGGCPMGDDFRSGVVNHVGQVFACDPERPDAVYDDLVVLDGAIVPTSLGINPALTIAGLALRAIENLRHHWGFTGGPGLPDRPSRREWTRPLVRPVFRVPPQPPVQPVETEVQLIERLRGYATLADGKEHFLELTLHSRPVALAALRSPTGARRRIRYDRDASVLRVFDREPSAIEDDPRGSPEACDPKSQRPCFEARAKVDGSLDLLQLAPTTWCSRTRPTLFRWLKHRGVRDFLQSVLEGVADRIAGRTPPGDRSQPGPGVWKRLTGPWAMASRAGARRTLDYTLKLSDFEVAREKSAAALFGEGAAQAGAKLEARGQKTLTYDGRTSPWQQLMELTLHQFPGLPSTKPATLRLDLPYLARQGVALLRVVRQPDHVHALVDLASFHLYVLRTVLDGHMWSFRLPDRVPDREIHRLPGALRLPGEVVLNPEVTELKVAEVKVNHQQQVEPVHLRLTRYRPVAPRAGQPPVLLIHGYSASGTTFVHPTLRPGLAGRLVLEGRDVWVLDLRSSAGMRWSTHPWSFEEIGCEDIPLAVDHVVRTCQAPLVDVVAHCMGSAMLCMALLGDIPAHPLPGDGYSELRRAMRGRLRRIVLSQVGPLVVMSPTNQARAFLMRYVKQIIPMGEYSFRPEPDGSMTDNLLDRLLATLPYPRDEFRIENPLWPPWAARPWVRTRRRMDILYGQVFKVANLSRATLACLDDFFGRMNVETVSQVIHFARTRAITDKQGRHVFATRDQLSELQHYEIRSIHGKENGLVDESTADLLTAELDGGHYRAERFEGFGHQDCLIGKDSRKIFEAIVTFLA